MEGEKVGAGEGNLRELQSEIGEAMAYQNSSEENQTAKLNANDHALISRSPKHGKPAQKKEEADLVFFFT